MGGGFIIEHRREYPPFRGERVFIRERIVITSGHCPPRLPPRHAASFWCDRSLPGPLTTPTPDESAECLFADPVADIAVLGNPDRQLLGEQADAYDVLTEKVSALRVAETPQSGGAWLLSLDGQWVPCTITLGQNQGLYIDSSPKNEPGMSSSPILADDGSVIGVPAVGSESTDRGSVRKPERSGPQPVLAHYLPKWLLRSAR